MYFLHLSSSKFQIHNTVDKKQWNNHSLMNGQSCCFFSDLKEVWTGDGDEKKFSCMLFQNGRVGLKFGLHANQDT